MDEKGGPILVVDPNSLPVGAQAITVVGLPYHTGHPLLDAQTLIRYENACVENLHLRCLEAEMSGCPFKALFLELLLTGNGALLSDRALEQLGNVARHHNLREKH